MQRARLTWLRARSLVALGMGTVMLLAGSTQTQQTASIAGLEEGAEKTLIDDLVIADHILAEQGALDAFGHVSARHPKNPQRFLMSRSLAPALVKAEDVMEYHLDGNAVDPKGRTSFLERFVHSQIYRTRPDVNAIVHSHAPAVIAFGTTQTPPRPITLVAAFLPQRVPIFEIRRVAGMTNMLEPALGTRAGGDVGRELGGADARPRYGCCGLERGARRLHLGRCQIGD